MITGESNKQNRRKFTCEEGTKIQLYTNIKRWRVTRSKVGNRESAKKTGPRDNKEKVRREF